jgi:hypothetical protein
MMTTKVIESTLESVQYIIQPLLAFYLEMSFMLTIIFDQTLRRKRKTPPDETEWHRVMGQSCFPHARSLQASRSSPDSCGSCAENMQLEWKCKVLIDLGSGRP